ncbi:UDP-glucose 6-dehydrogenase [Candidatus Roizmanbacteria bacterium CG11_big_fil_rev_8_21_14_0_20_36_8]|uniref:UDP-glucose 6-dehydrogenase n=2 Tax=Candidatus Roizmaniibacteriota TaxID=1752723 RepID=A0A2M6ITM8_9BACT|nr:MAG: UDP-glucose 6-dehydrogenase [Candidatus Roizmanbacteria bacterium CG11_big_fil_rev_8_21_14_0_20_36_8]PIZ65049.1 MAG: UDP-glucose 6-dehydrogenase [Candidatus Roizmanbacteria bacterium CG_4_10_14_0_2_um_filter_36_9]
MIITFIGHGYVGLVTACVFADFGNDVFVIGHTPEKVKKLNNGDPLIYEPGLKELLRKNLDAGRIQFTLDYEKAIPGSEVVFIAVGTPPTATGEADLSAVLKVAENIGKNLNKGYAVVSCKSTVPVGTNLKVEEIINKVKQDGAEFDVASCPEFLREGTAINDTLYPDRVVVGSKSKKAVDVILKAHKSLPGERVITDLASAEIIKYASNAMLATKISFANLISLYAEESGADIETIMDAVGADNRIGRKFLYAGIGYGGSCFPKDVMALNETGKHLKLDTGLLDAVEQINRTVRDNMLKKIINNVDGKNIAIWGLSFKPNTDDIRFSPSVYIIQDLLKADYSITAYDPAAMENVKKLIDDKIKYVDDIYEAVDGADALIIMTEWNEFKQANIEKVIKLLKKPQIIDGRNIYNPDQMKAMGISYLSTGRKAV